MTRLQMLEIAAIASGTQTAKLSFRVTDKKRLWMIERIVHRTLIKKP